VKDGISKDYHDYVFKDGEFIGAFEEMYRDVDDPWHHGDATAIHYDLALFLLKRHVSLHGGRALDLGCGKGAFTVRLKEIFPNACILGVDIAPTAIKKASEKYNHLGIEFKVFDAGKYWDMADKVGKDFQLVVMSDIMWYILSEFESVVKYLDRIVSVGGYLLINQTFYPLDEQKYGRETASSVEDMLKLIPYELVETIEVKRSDSQHAIMLFQVETQEM